MIPIMYTDIYIDYIINNLPHFLFWKNPKSVFLGCNRLFANSAGLLSPQDIIGKTDFDLPWNKYAEEYIKDDQVIMATGIAKLNYEEKHLQTNNLEKIMLVSKVPMFDKEKIIGILGIYTDITKLKIAEKNLETAKEQAEIANQLKSEFINNIMHDIRTPFSGILTLAKLLEDKENDLLKKEYLGDIAKSANELLNYCNNILLSAKAEVLAKPILARKFSLRDLIEKIILMETPSFKSKNLEMIFDYAKGVPEIIIGDNERIMQLLLNLISNAIKFTQEGYIKVTIEVGKWQNTKTVILLFIIEDTGIGIPTEKIDYIYEKFMKVTSSAQSSYKGSGLGLQLVKKIIEEIEGEIEVKSIPSKSTKFVCTIPFTVPLIEEHLPLQS